MQSLLKERKTIRKYKQETISDQIIEEMLECAFRTPTTGNMQLYSVVINKDEKKKALLAPTHFNQPTFTNAPVSLTFCADYNRFIKWCECRNAKPGYDNFLSFMTAAMDALLVAQSFCLLAESKGYGTCFLGTTAYNAESIAKILELPKFVVPILTLTIGIPDENAQLQDRLPASALIHHETYKDYTNEDIDQIYKEKENLPDSIRFIQENNKETLAQVYTDIRYKKADNEAFSSALLSFLKKQGFME
ncbi:MAG: nitroreductase family protein [Paludibacteraceae bacterium]|nr:nitroreductase family protein [Paludibacteraceae bacterium]